MSELLFEIGVNLVLGVLLLALLRWKRRPDSAHLANPTEALEEFQRHFPGASGTATVSADGRAALVESSAGLGLLLRDGLRWNARMLVPQELAAVRARDAATLELRFVDFGWPRACVRFEDLDASRRWRERLETLVHSGTPAITDLRHA